MEYDYRELAERVYDIFERGAVDELSTVFEPDFIEHDELPGTIATGRDLVAEWVTMSSTAFPDATYAIESVVGSGAEAVVRVRFTGTHRGDFWGIAPTGRTVDVMLIDWVRIGTSARVAEHWGAMQESKLMTQLGVPQQATTIDLTTPATTTV
jgi:predicted ester cyclase